MVHHVWLSTGVGPRDMSESNFGLSITVPIRSNQIQYVFFAGLISGETVRLTFYMYRAVLHGMQGKQQDTDDDDDDDDHDDDDSDVDAGFQWFL